MKIFSILSALILLSLIFTTPQYAAGNISPLIFGTNLGLYDMTDQFITSQATRNLITQIHVQIIRMPIRGVGAPAPQEIAAAQDIKAMGAVPLVILKFSQPDPAGAGKLVMQSMSNIFGNSTIYYEFGNERDINGVDQVTYTNTWNQVIPQLKPINPNAKFVGPVNGYPNVPYIAYFVAHANPQPDVVSYHQYTCSSSETAQACLTHIPSYATHLNEIKTAIAQTGKPVPPIMLTEWNYDPVPPANDSRVTPQFEQQYTQAMFNELSKDGFFATMQYVVTGSGVYQMIDSTPQLTAEGQIFGQMYETLIGGNNQTPTVQPTNPQTTTTIPPGSTIFNLTICPHGLGNCGDNANANSGGNTNPLHPQRTVTFTIFDANNQQVGSGQGNVNYNSTAKNFQGSVSINNLTNGSYLAQVKIPGFLPKQLPGIITITSPAQTITLPQVSLVSGDVNKDSQLDILDYNFLISCFGSKASTPSCPDKISSDINDDGSIDGTDYNLFLRELSVQK